MPCREAGAEAVRVHTTDLLENPGLLWDYHLLAVPGGFSWGDDHGAGVILALRLRLALGSALQEFINAGRLVIGICNGFQVLVNLGLLPGLPGRTEARLTALIPNDCGNFRDAWVHLKAVDSKCVFTQGLDHLELPIRHGEGKFYADGPVLAELADRGQIALKYATPSGGAAMGRFPHNPNGSLLDIAGIWTPPAGSWASCPTPKPTSPPSSTPPGPGKKKPGAAGANPTPNRSAPAWPSSGTRCSIWKRDCRDF